MLAALIIFQYSCNLYFLSIVCLCQMSRVLLSIQISVFWILFLNITQADMARLGSKGFKFKPRCKKSPRLELLVTQVGTLSCLAARDGLYIWQCVQHVINFVPRHDFVGRSKPIFHQTVFGRVGGRLSHTFCVLNSLCFFHQGKYYIINKC